MKKLFTAAGIVAVSLLGAQESHAQSKVWSISAVLRGFYDDNYNTAPSSPSTPAAKARDSFGVEISPTIALNMNHEGTTLYGLSYTYGAKYYEDRDSHSVDQTHQVSAYLDHSFSDRYRLKLSDSFVVAQEPELLDPGVTATPIRSDGDNVRNLANASFTAGLTRLLSLEVGYQNLFYDYKQDGDGSRSALLDRMEHLISANLRWQALEHTVALLGYQFGIVDQTSSDNIDAAGTFPANWRDNRSHYFYVGVDHEFTPTLSGSLRAGGQYTEFPQLPGALGLDDNTFGPYVDGSLRWTYAQGSFLQLGVRHSRITTDALALDTATTALYGNLSHKITPKITCNLLVQGQASTFNQTLPPATQNVDDKTDYYLTTGISFAYAFNQYLSAEAGYNYDRLYSKLQDRSFTRNRVFIGVRASY